MKTLGILYDQTGSGKSKMAAADAAIFISQLADLTAAKCRRIAPHLRGPAIKWKYFEYCATKPKPKSKMAADDAKYSYSLLRFLF
jgi:hypothetical protein